ncbi:non-hydrolyzing UDP-N-acetylglucosamine 2-epimerase [Chloroflexota bacterium]
MKIISIVGARPEFIQAMPVSQALRAQHKEILVHTGQHYDFQMSQTFFDELGIPAPDYNLEVGSGSQASQTAQALVRLEEVFLKEEPDLVIVRGDTNSTLAGALAAAKLHIPVAHIEAGERSFERRMPEEINRLVTDAIAELHFCVSHTAIDHLAREGVSKGVYWVGDVMLDALLQVQPIARRNSKILSRLNLTPKNYSLVTIHRPANTDDPIRLNDIVDVLNEVSEPVVFPIHPRTRKTLQSNGVHFEEHIQTIDPVGYLDMLILEENARLIATDSGGVQREAYYLGIPCLTLRNETEWVGTVDVGWNELVGADKDIMLDRWYKFDPPAEKPPIYGDGKAAQRIADVLGEGAVQFGQYRGKSFDRYTQPIPSALRE